MNNNRKNIHIKASKLFWLLFLLFAFHLQVAAQGGGENTAKLAEYYYSKGEFDKAEPYFEDLYKTYKSKTYFVKYTNCLVYQKKYEEAEKVVNKRIKRDAFDYDYQFLLADIYQKTDRQKQADQLYQSLIDDMAPVQSRVQQLGKLFTSKGLFDYAIQTYTKGREILSGGYAFNLELADLYGSKNQIDLMIQEYLKLLDYSSTYLRTVQMYLSRQIDFEEDQKYVTELKNQLLKRLQDSPQDQYNSEMLIWFYLQTKAFNSAVIQAKALDARTKSEGRKLMEVAQVCKFNKDYSSARKAYNYVLEMGEKGRYYQQALHSNLDVSYVEITTANTLNQTEIQSVVTQFETVLSQYGYNESNVEVIQQLANLKAFYLNQAPQADQLINQALTYRLSSLKEAELKVQLGDIYVIEGKLWEASLLYMKVSNDFSEDPLGHEAKFKNAKVFFYTGEFEYAKAQLDVLKASTSKLIANDAMQLSLLLQDNLGIDTTKAPVQIYAYADLLLQQNKYDEAINQLDTIQKYYPFHSIIDEVLFKKAEIYEKQLKWDQAINYYQQVITSYSFDILGDDAAYRLAKIYDTKLNQPEKAADYYKMILFDFSGSLYTAEARERYRAIKGV